MTTTDITIERLEKAEFDLVAAIALPATTRAMREKATAVLAKLRATKRALLARSPNVLRKSSTKSRLAEPSWRGLPVDNIAAETLAKEARSRAADRRRLANPARG
jgi:hypothetical protein